MTTKLRLTLLTSEETTRIFEKCVEFLSKKGVKIDHREAAVMLKKAGADVSFDDGLVRFPRDVIETALRTVPHEVTLASRNGKNNVLPEPNGLFYARSNTGSRNIVEPDKNKSRPVTLSDVAEWGQLTEALDDISFGCFLIPSDVPPKTADIYALKTVFENTSKHIIVQPQSYGSVEYLFELAQAVAGSSESLRENPVMDILSCSITPLTFKDMDMEVIIRASRHGIPIAVSSLPSAGATSPITTAGTVLLCGIEILAQLVMCQMLAPGLPVIGQAPVYTLDMLTTRNLGSSVEAILAAAASVQFINNAFSIPTQTLGFATDSYIADGQYTMETALRALVISLAGCDILGGAGRLNALGASSPIQLVIDNAIARILKRTKTGIKVDDETMAWQEILDISPGDHFLELEHTLRHCREALHISLLVTGSLESWVSEGSKDLYARATDIYSELKRTGQPPHINEDVQREMNLIVKRADDLLAGN